MVEAVRDGDLEPPLKRRRHTPFFEYTQPWCTVVLPHSCPLPREYLFSVVSSSPSPPTEGGEGSFLTGRGSPVRAKHIPCNSALRILRFMNSRHLQNSDVSWGHEPRMKGRRLLRVLPVSRRQFPSISASETPAALSGSWGGSAVRTPNRFRRLATLNSCGTAFTGRGNLSGEIYLSHSGAGR